MPLDNSHQPASISITRVTTPDQVAALLPLGQRAHTESAFRSIPLDLEKRRAFALRAIQLPHEHLILSANRDDNPVGYLIAANSGFFFAQTSAVSVTTIYVTPEHRGSSAALKLLSAVRKWAQEREAQHVFLHVTSGVRPVQTDRALRKLGFSFLGGNYMLSLKPKA